MKNVITTILSVASVLISVSVHSIEALGYAVLASEGDIEIRKYEPHLLASVRVTGDFEDAGSKAFRPLFKFITGENTSDSKIATVSYTHLTLPTTPYV